MALANSYSIIKELMDAGVSEKEAEVLVRRFVAKDEIEQLKNELATKSDVIHLESKIEVVNTNINWLKAISIANFTVLLGSVVTVAISFLLK